jgi:phospholipid/cholesterol/gamma-HCH transport system substrate-binding protein
VEQLARQSRLHPAWWTLILLTCLVTVTLLCAALFNGSFRSYIFVSLTSDRAGLVMESGAKVKLRGVQVGRVAAVSGSHDGAQISLQIYPDQIEHIPANVGAQIRATTAFGVKYVDLIYPQTPSRQRIAPGAVLHSRNVTTEVNTVFQNLVQVLRQIDPAKLNATLTAFADGLRGRGDTIGQAITDANEVLSALNARSDTVRQDWRALDGFNNTYNAAAPDILKTLAAVSTTSVTISGQAADLDALLLNAIGLSRSGIDLLGPNQANLIRAINVLQPTNDLLMKYNPEYTCLLLGAKYFLDNGGYQAIGGNGRSVVLDSTFTLGDDPYRYPDNLPIVAAKGGPGGKPGCGSLPEVAKNYPVRLLVTNTGFGTGLDYRPNPGIGHPWYIDYFPVTRAVPEPPSIRGAGPPAIGPVPYPGAPVYGSPQPTPDPPPLLPQPIPTDMPDGRP